MPCRRAELDDRPPACPDIVDQPLAPAGSTDTAVAPRRAWQSCGSDARSHDPAVTVHSGLARLGDARRQRRLVSMACLRVEVWSGATAGRDRPARGTVL